MNLFATVEKYINCQFTKPNTALLIEQIYCFN